MWTCAAEQERLQLVAAQLRTRAAHLAAALRRALVPVEQSAACPLYPHHEPALLLACRSALHTSTDAALACASSIDAGSRGRESFLCLPV